MGLEAQLPAAATAASSGKLPAPPPTSLAHCHRTHTEPLIGRQKLLQALFHKPCYWEGENAWETVRGEMNAATRSDMASYKWCIHAVRSSLLPQGDPLKTFTWLAPHAIWKACVKPRICAGFYFIALHQINLTKALLTDWALVNHSLEWGHIVWMTQSVEKKTKKPWHHATHGVQYAPARIFILLLPAGSNQLY